MLDTLRLYFMGGGTLPHPPPLGDSTLAVPAQAVGQSAPALALAHTLACACMCACMCVCVPYASAAVGGRVGRIRKEPGVGRALSERCLSIS